MMGEVSPTSSDWVLNQSLFTSLPTLPQSPLFSDLKTSGLFNTHEDCNEVNLLQFGDLWDFKNINPENKEKKSDCFEKEGDSPNLCDLILEEQENLNQSLSPLQPSLGTPHFKLESETAENFIFGDLENTLSLRSLNKSTGDEICQQMEIVDNNFVNSSNANYISNCDINSISSLNNDNFNLILNNGNSTASISNDNLTFVHIDNINVNNNDKITHSDNDVNQNNRDVSNEIITLINNNNETNINDDVKNELKMPDNCQAYFSNDQVIYIINDNSFISNIIYENNKSNNNINNNSNNNNIDYNSLGNDYNMSDLNILLEIKKQIIHDSKKFEIINNDDINNIKDNIINDNNNNNNRTLNIKLSMDSQTLESKFSNLKKIKIEEEEMERKKYLEKRSKNNISSRKSRLLKKIKNTENEKLLSKLESENQKLKDKVRKLEEMTNLMKKELFKKILKR